MKALSLRQPWAEVVLRFGKRIENRRWNTAFRGVFLIHASSASPKAAYNIGRGATNQVSALEHCVRTCYLLGENETAEAIERTWASLPLAAIVGQARVVDVLSPGSTLAGMQHGDSPIDTRWHDPMQYGLVLADVVSTRVLREVKGALGFWDVTDAIAREAYP
jgi:hypothetical protein